MPYTAFCDEYLTRYDKQIDYFLELRTNFPESNDWAIVPLSDFTLTHEAGNPAALKAVLANDGFTYSAEQNPANPCQLLAEARLRCRVGGAGGEEETLFHGRVYRIEPQDYSLTILCHDWLALIHECECEVDLAPAETEEISPARQVHLVSGGAFGSVWGFTWDGTGLDPAFNQGALAGTRRRSWTAGDIRVWYDAAATQEVPPQHYQANLASGTLSILEDSSGREYYATGVRCYREGTLDWAEVVHAALAYPVNLGGIGAGAAMLDLPATGLEPAQPVAFQGKVGDLLRRIERELPANLKLWYDSRSGCFTLRVVTQQEFGMEDWELVHPQSIAQPRELRELYSRVVVQGWTERPRNALTEPQVTLTPRGDGDWFGWDGVHVGADQSFTQVAPYIFDGDLNLGAAVHNLPLTEGGGTDRYDSWYHFVTIDLGQAERIQRVRVTLPGSRNLNSAAGHQGHFWPGLRLLTSPDGSDWRLLSPLLCGRYPPGEQLEIQTQDLVSPKARYLQVLCGAYKHGLENENDPSIGLAELEVYTREEYRVIKAIDGAASPASFYAYTADYDGDGQVDQWQRNQPDLWLRLGGRHRTCFDDQRGELNEFLAHDRAIDLLAESVRLFQRVAYTAVADPRVRVYGTARVTDELNGGTRGMLIARVVLSPQGTLIEGVDYLATQL